MSEARIGRVLVASLHQAIADLLPTRLEFYENWLNVAGLREGTIGLAPLTAVLSFLRTEGHAYGLITSRAGEYAAAWTFENVPALKVRVIRALPAGLRARAALGTARALVRATYPSSRAITRIKKGVVTDRHPRIALLRGARDLGRAAVRLLRLGDRARAAALRRLGGSAGQRVPRLGRAPRLRGVGHAAGARRATARSRHDRASPPCAVLGLASMLQSAAAARRSRRRRRRGFSSSRSKPPAATAAPTGSAKRSPILMADDVNARGLGAITRTVARARLRAAAPAAERASSAARR